MQWEWGIICSWRTPKAGMGRDALRPPPFYSSVKSLSRPRSPKQMVLNPGSSQDTAASEPGGDGQGGWSHSPVLGGVLQGPLCCAESSHSKAAPGKGLSPSQSSALVLVPGIAPPVGSSLRRGAGYRQTPKAVPSAAGGRRVWPGPGAAPKNPKPIPGWVGQGVMRVPVGFGVKSRLSAQTFLHPSTHHGPIASRLPLAKSWPQKCQFHSNLGLKDV